MSLNDASGQLGETYISRAGRYGYIFLVMVAACVVVGAGCYQFLSWLPDTLGRLDEHGDWKSARYTLSCLGATGGLWLVLQVGKTAEALYWRRCERTMLHEYKNIIGATPDQLKFEYGRLLAMLEASDKTVESLTGSAKAKAILTREAYAELVAAVRPRMTLTEHMQPP